MREFGGIYVSKFRVLVEDFEGMLTKKEQPKQPKRVVLL